MSTNPKIRVYGYPSKAPKKNPNRFYYTESEHFKDHESKVKFDFYTHVFAERPLKYQFPELQQSIYYVSHRYPPINENIYLNVKITGTKDFHVFVGDKNLKQASFDPFFNNYGTFNEVDKILHLHLGFLIQHKPTYEEYTSRTIYHYLKYYSPIFIHSNSKCYSIQDFYHEYRHPLTHLIHCYADELPLCPIEEYWRSKKKTISPIQTVF